MATHFRNKNFTKEELNNAEKVASHQMADEKSYDKLKEIPDACDINAKISFPKVLQWYNPLTRQDEIFEPKIDTDFGGYRYRVPTLYARRLIGGEPLKYTLIKPSILTHVQYIGKNGGIRHKNIERGIPMRDDNNQVVKDEQGFVVFTTSSELARIKASNQE